MYSAQSVETGQSVFTQYTLDARLAPGGDGSKRLLPTQARRSAAGIGFSVWRAKWSTERGVLTGLEHVDARNARFLDLRRFKPARTPALLAGYFVARPREQR